LNSKKGSTNKGLPKTKKGQNRNIEDGIILQCPRNRLVVKYILILILECYTAEGPGPIPFLILITLFHTFVRLVDV
jgi:hypothetical protein